MNRLVDLTIKQAVGEIERSNYFTCFKAFAFTRQYKDENIDARNIGPKSTISFLVVVFSSATKKIMRQYFTIYRDRFVSMPF
jgi:hypothetical protein